MSSYRQNLQLLIAYFVSMKPFFCFLIVLIFCTCTKETEETVPQALSSIKPVLRDSSMDFPKIHIIQELKEGVIHEYKQYYYSDSSIAMQGPFVSFVKQGWWEEFHVSGKIKSKGGYHQNKKQGEWYYYFDTGILRKNGPFNKGKKQGWWKEYDNKNQLISEGNYIEGKKHGYWITYENKLIKTEGKYENGEAVGFWKYYRNGKLTSTFDFE